MSKKISVLVAVIIILIEIIIFLSGLFAYQYFAIKALRVVQPSTTKANPQTTTEKNCLNSGGKITTALCCGETNDFPDSCLIGACGCSLTNSHQVKICSCGNNKCFNGKTCVSLPELPQTNNVQENQNTSQNQAECNTNSDCQNGASCLVEGPIIAGQPLHKVCVPKGQAIQL